MKTTKVQGSRFKVQSPFGSYAEFRASIAEELDKQPRPHMDTSYRKHFLGRDEENGDLGGLPHCEKELVLKQFTA